jgi:hypothetical protein
MSKTDGFNKATHFSIVWGVTLAVLTLLEWRSLDRDPLGHQILTPFIEREVTVHQLPRQDGQLLDFSDEAPPEAASKTQYEVEFHFNGPLFLLCFFGPVLAFQGLGWLARRYGSAS